MPLGDFEMHECSSIVVLEYDASESGIQMKNMHTYSTGLENLIKGQRWNLKKCLKLPLSGRGGDENEKYVEKYCFRVKKIQLQVSSTICSSLRIKVCPSSFHSSFPSNSR